MSKAGSQFTRSTNCMAAECVSNPVTSGIVTRKQTIEPARASERAGIGLRSDPILRIATPKTMGSQIARLRSGRDDIAKIRPCLSTNRAAWGEAATESERMKDNR